MIPKRNFVPVQVNPELVHCSGMKFHSGIMKNEKEFRKSQMVIKVKASASRAYAFDLARRPRFGAERVDHVNFILHSSELIPK